MTISTTPIKEAITCIEPVKGIAINKAMIAAANVTLLLNLSLINVLGLHVLLIFPYHFRPSLAKSV